jgi:acetoin utilization protein AcuB
MTVDNGLKAEVAHLHAENDRLRAQVATLEARDRARTRVCEVLRATNSTALAACDVMTPDPETVRLGDKLRTVVELLRARCFRRLPVLDESGALVGIITDRDVRLASNSPLVLHERWQDEMLLDQVEVDVCMTPEPVTVRPETPIYEVAHLLRTRKFGSVPVVDAAGALVGILTETDLLRAFEDALEVAAAAVE